MSNLIHNFLSNRVLSRFTIFVIDILMIMFSCLVMYLMRYGFVGLTPEVRADGITLGVILVFCQFDYFYIVSYIQWHSKILFILRPDENHICINSGLRICLSWHCYIEEPSDRFLPR